MPNDSSAGPDSSEFLPEPVSSSPDLQTSSERVNPQVGADAAMGSRSQLPPEDEGGTDWKRYIGAVFRNKWLVAAATVVGVAGGAVAAKLEKPGYMVEATIWIEPGDRTGSGPIQSGQLLFNKGWIELLKSYTVLDAAVEELRLYLSFGTAEDSTAFQSFFLGVGVVPGAYVLAVDDAGAQLTLATRGGIVVERAAVGDSIGGSLGFLWSPPVEELTQGRVFEFSVVMPRDAARALAEQLRLRTDREGTFLRAQLSGTKPRRITNTLNAVVNRLVTVAAEMKREKLTTFTTVLRDQLDQADASLRELETALQILRMQTIGLPSGIATALGPGISLSGDSQPGPANFFEMQILLEQLRDDRAAIEQILADSLEPGFSPAALEGLPTVQGSSELALALTEVTTRRAELRDLRLQFTDEHPLIRQKVDEVAEIETTSIVPLAVQLVEELQDQEAQYAGRLEMAAAELEQIPARLIEEARLARDVGIAEALYNTLQQRYAQARLAEESSIADIRILDPAIVPVRPVSKHAMQLLLMGLAGGFGLGVVGAIARDKLDARVLYPKEVTVELGLPVLGAVPHIRGRRNGLVDGAENSVLEALRGVRLNLVYAYGTAGPLIVTITSPGSRDGKSFIASNLALAFTDAGSRTLLVDGDSRRGELHRMLRCARKPGLTDCLAGNASQTDVVQETEYPLLKFIGCGTRTGDAPELLSSSAMPRLVTGLRSSYDVIIIDSPPLGAGVDALALATVTGNVLLVVRLGVTDRALAEAKLDVLDRLPVRILGAILNGVRQGSALSYYSSYLPGYDHDDEEGGPIRKLIGGGTG